MSTKQNYAALHPGELYIHQKLQIPPQVQVAIHNVTKPEMPQQHSEFFTNLHYFVISMLDSKERPWATIIAGKGSLKATSTRTLEVSTTLPLGDPFLQCLSQQKPGSQPLYAGLGIDFSNRRRNRVAGYISSWSIENSTNIKMTLVADQNMGNCPKYITVRQLQMTEEHKPQVVESILEAEHVKLSEEEIAIISQASTVFLASRHNGEAADLGLNHRGGPKGLVRYYEEDGDSYVIVPDFSGNRFYQSLGNIQSDRVAGVLFPDFNTGDLLHITGTAENLFDQDSEKIMPRTKLITRIKITGKIFIKQSLPLKLTSPEMLSPYNPPVRYLKSELEKMGQVEAKENSAKLIKIEKLSSKISTFTFKVDVPFLHTPAGYAILGFSDHFKREYRHMNDGDPKNLNEDYIRTWTISSAPGGVFPDFKEIDVFSCTIKNADQGLLSNFLHSKTVDEANPLIVKFLGAGGGVGVTPFLAMYETIKNADVPVDLVVFFSARMDEIKLVEKFKDLKGKIQISIFDSTVFESKKLDYGAQLFNRRISDWDFKNCPDIKERTVFVCGSVPLMDATKGWLAEAGVAPQNIHNESFAF